MARHTLVADISEIEEKLSDGEAFCHVAADGSTRSVKNTAAFRHRSIASNYTIN